MVTVKVKILWLQFSDVHQSDMKGNFRRDLWCISVGGKQRICCFQNKADIELCSFCTHAMSYKCTEANRSLLLRNGNLTPMLVNFWKSGTLWVLPVHQTDILLHGNSHLSDSFFHKASGSVKLLVDNQEGSFKGRECFLLLWLILWQKSLGNSWRAQKWRSPFSAANGPHVPHYCFTLL